MYEIWNRTGKDCHNRLQLAHAGNDSPAVQYTIQYHPVSLEIYRPRYGSLLPLSKISFVLVYTHVLCVGVFMRTQGECKEPGGFNFSAEHLWMPGRISQALKCNENIS
ncbi:hypothetical protein DAPPUDRAFT_240783 [Daphnia pulex]|uniref:Uncharacterized protein n=1 Tax=Daphnia pulex TaxID=6669 RepID=E9GCJ7_DAPPU|nr:hypothetical protein DAPPUDRAFT_240783 [Daphnia pulex]|eukprot:EFX82851.1 hypothetical protein DAPPUDRAFT_240783 [Daphnia pulex]